MNRQDHFFIYPKDKKGKRLGNTICVILRDGSMFQGEAICSPEDQFNRKTGRMLSFQRALDEYTRYLQKVINKG